MLFFRNALNGIKNLIARCILPNSSLKMGKLDMQHEEMLAMLARSHERQRASAKALRATWLRDHADTEPQDHDRNVGSLTHHDIVLRSK